MVNKQKSILQISILVSLYMLIESCAFQVMPSGGPVDNIPPKVEMTYPKDKAINFQDNTIRLKFDEFVELNGSLLTHLIISPVIEEMPSASIVGKTVKLDFNNPFQRNRTYVLSFQQAFKDFVEGNLLQDFTLTFSTGKNIDSSNVSVVSKFKDNLVSTKTRIALANTRDDFFKNKFQYIAQPTINNSVFTNLDKNNYYLYGFVDSNDNMKWDKNEYVAFQKEMISRETKRSSLTFFKDKSYNQSPQIVAKSDNLFQLILPDEIYGLQLDNQQDATLTSLGKRDHFICINPEFNQDSIRIITNNEKVAFKYLKDKKVEEIGVLTTSVVAHFVEKQNPKEAALYFNKYIKIADREKIKIKEDTMLYSKASLKVAKNQITITGLEYNRKYEITFEENALVSNTQYNKKLIHSITTNTKEECHPTLLFTFTPEIKEENLLVFYTEKNGINRKIEPKNNIFELKEYCNKEIQFIFIYDSNKNGKWDTGDINTMKQPEEYLTQKVTIEDKENYIVKWKK